MTIKEGTPASPAQIKEAIEGLLWYHSIDVAPGVTTPGWFDLRHAVDAAGEVHDPLASQDFARPRHRAEPGRQVQRTAPISVLDPHGLARVEPDADRERERRIGDRGLHERGLQIDRGLDRLSGRREDGQYLVAAELEPRSTAGLEDRLGDRREAGGQDSSSFVATLLRERGVPADVGDQEDLERRRR